MTVRMRARPHWVSAEEVARHPYVADCHIGGCFYSVACATLDEAIWEQISHRCPRRGDPMETGLSLLDRAWAQLDAQVDEIYVIASDSDVRISPTVANALELAKAKARGKAEILALLMHPYYVDADEISLEAAARAQARTTGTPHRTLGLDPAHAGADLEAVQRARAS